MPRKPSKLDTLLFADGGSTTPMSPEDISSYIDSGTGIATDALGYLTNKAQYKGASKGKLIGNVAGTALGSILGPAGAAVGGKIFGTLGEIIGQGSDNRHMNQDLYDKTLKQYNNLNVGANINPYGTTYADGGNVNTAPPQPGPIVASEADYGDPNAQPQKRQINIEKGEIMVNPKDFSILREFSNKNRYSAHKSKQFDEPIGNFVNVSEGAVIIPKKLSPRYKNGDMLTRKSIVMQLLTDQQNDPMHNVPEEMQPETETPTAKKGGWIKGAVNPAHKGYCTPMTKSTCTPRRKAFAKTMKKHHGFHEEGGLVYADGGGTPYVTPRNPLDFIWGGAGPQTPQNLPPGVTPAMVTSNNQSVYPTPTGAAPPNQPVQWPMQSGNPVQAVIDNPVSVASPQPTGQPAAVSTTGSKTNWGMVTRKALNNLPILAQMAINNQGDPFLTHNPNSGYNMAINYANQLPEDISVAEPLAANDRSYASAIRSNDTGNRSERAAMLGAKIAGDNQVYGNKEAVGAQLKSSKLQQLMGLEVQQGADSQQDNARYNETASQNAAARDNNFSAGLSNLVNNELQAGNDKEVIKALNSMTHLADLDPYSEEMLKDDPGALNYIMATMMAGKGAITYEQAKDMRYQMMGKVNPDKTTNTNTSVDYNTNKQKGTISRSTTKTTR